MFVVACLRDKGHDIGDDAEKVEGLASDDDHDPTTEAVYFAGQDGGGDDGIVVLAAGVRALLVDIDLGGLGSQHLPRKSPPRAGFLHRGADTHLLPCDGLNAATHAVTEEGVVVIPLGRAEQERRAITHLGQDEDELIRRSCDVGLNACGEGEGDGETCD